MSHGCGEVARRDEEDVDVVDFQNLVEVLVGDDVFDEDYEQGVVVGFEHVVGDAVALSAGVCAAFSDGWEFAAIDDVAGFGGVVDMRDDDALCAAVEGAVYQSLGVGVDADYWRYPPEVACAGEVAQVGRIDSGVLSFEPYSGDVVSGGDWSESVDVVRVR